MGEKRSTERVTNMGEKRIVLDPHAAQLGRAEQLLTVPAQKVVRFYFGDFHDQAYVDVTFSRTPGEDKLVVYGSKALVLEPQVSNEVNVALRKE